MQPQGCVRPRAPPRDQRRRRPRARRVASATAASALPIAVAAPALATALVLQTQPPPPTTSGSRIASGADNPPSAVGKGVQAAVRQSHAKPGSHGFGEHKSTHRGCAGAPFRLTRRQTRIGGQTTSSQSETHAPFSQCAPAGHVTPMHAVSTHFGIGAARSHVSPAGQGAPGVQAHDGMQRPSSQTDPSGHVTSAHGSTQPKPRQTCPNGQRTPGWHVGTQCFDSSQVRPAGQPKSVQSSGAQTHVPLSVSFAKREPVAQPKSSSGTHSGTHAPSQHPFFRGQRSGARPLQLWSFTASHVSGAPGNVAGSRSSQSHGVPENAQPHAANPSPSSSGHTTPASHASSPAATRVVVAIVTAIASAAVLDVEATIRARILVLLATGDKASARAVHGRFCIRMRLARVFVPVLLAASMASCATDDPVGPSGPTTPFTVWVLDAPIVLGAVETPVVAAKVAFDPPAGGERITKTTEPDGHATFEADFTRGSATVTVLSDAHVYVTMLEASPEAARARPNALGKPASDLVVVPPRLDDAVTSATVELRGTITGKQDANHVVSIGASRLARLGGYQALEDTYVLRAPRGEPFFLLGHETRTLVDAQGLVVENDLVKSFRLDLPARTEDELLDLDVAKLPALTNKRVRVRVEPPAAFGEGTRAVASTGSADSSVGLGIFAGSVAAGRAFDVDVAVVDTDVSPERPVSQALLTRPDGSQSLRIEPGPMQDGQVWKDFAAPPEVVDPDASRTVKDPIAVEGIPDGAELQARLYAGGKLVWIVNGPPAASPSRTFTIPYRDEVTSVDVQVFALSVSARSGRVALSPRGEVYKATSTFRDVTLRKR